MTADPCIQPGSSKLISIEEILHARSYMPIATSRKRGWSGVTVDLHAPRLKCAESYSGLDHHLICYSLRGSGRLAQGRAGVVHRSAISAGTSFIMPSGYSSTWEGDSALSARLRVPTSLVAAAAEQVGRRSTAQVEIRNVFEVRDPIIGHLALTMLAELNMSPHPAQALIVDTVSTAIAAHMLRHYNVFEPAEWPDEHSLSRHELARLSAFIEDNLHRTITLEELAAVVNVSRFHFSRLFKRSTGATAISFVETCRIRRAQQLIAETDLPLVEIALITGFADQSHFTRRFHRQVGCTPAAFARDQGRRRSVRRSH